MEAISKLPMTECECTFFIFNQITLNSTTQEQVWSFVHLLKGGQDLDRRYLAGAFSLSVHVLGLTGAHRGNTPRHGMNIQGP